MTLMTSHLESTKEHAEERQRQLKVCFKAMEQADPDTTVVFGGDLNLRDTEVPSQLTRIFLNGAITSCTFITVSRSRGNTR